MQYGVTQEMIDRYKQIVFEKSVNVQVRRGDPVRRRDWDGVEEQRELQGLTDAQIAAQLHLMEQQVTFIRIDAERERYTLDAHAMLYRLEGNRGKHVNSYAATPTGRGPGSHQRYQPAQHVYHVGGTHAADVRHGDRWEVAAAPAHD